MELASSDAAAILFFLKEEKEKNGGAKRADRVVRPYKRCDTNRKSGPMSTRKGQAASVTLFRREQLRLASAPTGADKGAAEKIGGFLFARKSGIICLS